VTDYTTTTYSDGDKTYEAVGLTWEAVEAVLGEPHRGTAEDDVRLVDALVEAGAPAWVRNASGGLDEDGWYLVGDVIEA
jgi:hypothetical protein